MKKAVTISGIILMSLICFLSTGINTGYSTNPDSKTHSVTENENQSFISANLNYPESPSENIVNIINSPPVTQIKDKYKEISTALKVTESLIENLFREVNIFEGLSYIRYRKYNLIFPFHHFW